MLQADLAFYSLQLGPVCVSSESAPAAAETSVVNCQMSLQRAYMHHFVPVVYTWSELQMSAVHEKNPTVAHVREQGKGRIQLSRIITKMPGIALPLPPKPERQRAPGMKQWWW